MYMRHISYAPTYRYLHVYKEFKISTNTIAFQDIQ